MGYLLSVYCEPKIFYKEELIEEISRFNPQYGLYSSFSFHSGYNFYGNYRIYNKKSFFYGFCEFLNSNFYIFFEVLDYVEDLGEWMQKDMIFNWHDLQEVKDSINNLVDKLNNINREFLFNRIEAKNNTFPKDYFRNYFPGNGVYGLIEDLKRCQTIIHIFQKYKAKKLLFAYD